MLLNLRVTSQRYFLHPSSSYLLGKTTPIKLKLGLQIDGRLLTTSNLPGPIKLSSQSTPSLRLCFVSYQCQQTVQKCWAKTILLSQL
jgi:hypothetical protein